jgi:hypothetical protein
MDYIKDLESNSSTVIRRAAEMIIKLQTRGCCDQLLKALIKEFDKPKAWKTQTLLIKAISTSQCISLLPNLYQFLDRKFESSILYKEIGFAIVMLENSEERIIDFLYKSITKDNELQISGACAGILCKKLIPPTIEIEKILRGIAKFTEHEGQKITPRCYIAATAYLWPKEEVLDFLVSCQKSHWKGLVEIAQNSLEGKESSIQLY